jgi:hypothetical protein
MDFVDDQIWQVYKNQTIRFRVPEYPIFTELEKD